MLDAQRPPVGLASVSSPEFHRCLPLARAPFVATLSRVNPQQIAGLWGDGPFGAVKGRSEECLHQFDQRSGVHNGLQFLKHHRFQRFKSILKEPFGTMQPLLALVLMVALVRGRSLGGERLVVPSQPECIS